MTFFWSRIGIVKARGCLLEFWFWLGIARIWAWLFNASSVPERIIGSMSRVEWILKLCIGIPRAALVAHSVGFVRATVLFWIGAWTVFWPETFRMYIKMRQPVERIQTASRYETVLGIRKSPHGMLGRNRSSLVTGRWPLLPTMVQKWPRD